MNARGILGVGVDLVETERMKNAIDKWGERFTEKVFGANERRYCEEKAESWRHYAGRFAVKEAVSKAFGTGIGEHVGWLDIEVIRDGETGAPSVRLSPRAYTMVRQRGGGDVLVSLSHTRRYAVAQAVLVASEPLSPGHNPEG